MSVILLPIKPRFVKLILAGDKKFEYRKSVPNKNVTKIVIYASSPDKRVVGEVDVRGVVSGSPEYVWAQTGASGGISREFFNSYFGGRDKAYAYILGDVKKYSKSLSLADFNVKSAPQNFVYLDE